mgnify:CR=1 FL=1
MNIDIRKSIINNFKGNSLDEIMVSINESIKKGDEITLPGLGVFFELLWSNADLDMQKTIIEIIKKSL